MSIAEKLNTHFGSKKFAIAVWGTANLLMVFVISLLTMIFCPPIAGQVAGLANIVVTFLGGVVGILIGGQSMVDWASNTNSSYKSESQSKFEDSRKVETHNENIDEHIVYEEKSSSPRPYSQNASGNE